jgi:hypothetical protein
LTREVLAMLLVRLRRVESGATRGRDIEAPGARDIASCRLLKAMQTINDCSKGFI